MKCSNCGAYVEGDAKQCPNCRREFITTSSITDSEIKGLALIIAICLFFIYMSVILKTIFYSIMSFLFSPGMLVMSIITKLSGLNLEVIPMWIFSVLCSLAVYALIWWALRNFILMLTTYIYLGSSVGIILVFLLCFFACDYKFPAEYAGYFMESKGHRSTIYVFVTAKVANIRKEPTTKSKIVGKAQKGEKLEALNRTGNWIHIKHPKFKGYIHKKLVKR